MRIAVGGAVPVVDPAGTLTLNLPGAALTAAAPRATQPGGDGDDDAAPVAAAYVLEPGGAVGVDLGAHDASRPLTVHVDLDTARTHGGRLAYASGIAADAEGNAYLTGTVRGMGSGRADAGVLVAKLDRDGRLLYEDHLAGNGDDAGLGIAVDKDGDAYVTGRTTSTDFPVRDAAQPHYRGDGDAFVARLDPAGRLVWASYLGGEDYDEATGIAVDRRGDVLVTGSSFSSDLAGAGAVPAVGTGGAERAFVAELDGAGRLVHLTTLGGPDGAASAIAAGREGNARIAGHGGDGAFAVGLADDGTVLSVTTLPGGAGATASGIAVDREGDAYIAGTTRSSGTLSTVLTALGRDGGIEHSPQLGGEGAAGGGLGLAVAVERGEVLVTGATAAGGCPRSDGRAVLLARLDEDAVPLSTTCLVTGDDDTGLGVAAGGGVVYVAGQSATRPAGGGGGEVDVLVTRLAPPFAAQRR